MPIELPSQSRYKFTNPIVTQEGIETFGIMTKPNFLIDSEYRNYRVPANYAHRPDLISTDVYGTPELYWALIMYNRPKNPFRWPENQAVIRVPSKSDVLFDM